MNPLKCEACGQSDFVKQNEFFVCQYCGMKYTQTDVQKMMIEGTVDVKGTVQVDNSSYVEKYLANARRAMNKNDWEEAEKYYNMVEQNAPTNIEAVFFSSYAKAVGSLIDSEYLKRRQKFEILVKSISVINDYFEETDENKEEVLRKISDAIKKMYAIEYTYIYDIRNSGAGTVGSKAFTRRLEDNVKKAFVIELKQIKAVHPELAYIEELINEYEPKETPEDKENNIRRKLKISTRFAILSVAAALLSILCIKIVYLSSIFAYCGMGFGVASFIINAVFYFIGGKKYKSANVNFILSSVGMVLGLIMFIVIIVNMSNWLY